MWTRIEHLITINEMASGVNMSVIYICDVLFVKWTIEGHVLASSEVSVGLVLDLSYSKSGLWQVCGE